MFSLSEFVMRSRRHAALTAVLCTFTPLCGWLGLAIMSLVALRKGLLEGITLFLWINLAGIVFAAMGSTAWYLQNILLTGSLCLLLAGILRYTCSWASVIKVCAFLGIMAVLLVHGFSHDIFHYWQAILLSNYQQAAPYLNLPLTQQQIELMAAWGAQFATGIQVLLVISNTLFILLMARWMQAKLYNPAGLSKELYAVRMDWYAVGLLLFILSFVLSGSKITTDLMPIAILPFTLSGLSLVHQYLSSARLMWVGFSVFYGVFIAFFPYVLAGLVLLALADTCFNLRERFNLGGR